MGSCLWRGLPAASAPCLRRLSTCPSHRLSLSWPCVPCVKPLASLLVSAASPLVPVYPSARSTTVDCPYTYRNPSFLHAVLGGRRPSKARSTSARVPVLSTSLSQQRSTVLCTSSMCPEQTSTSTRLPPASLISRISSAATTRSSRDPSVMCSPASLRRASVCLFRTCDASASG